MVDVLKKWNGTYPMISSEYDLRFLSYLLDAVFGRETLTKSSAYGKRANNSGKSHKALDPLRLNFVKSEFCVLDLLCVL